MPTSSFIGIIEKLTWFKMVCLNRSYQNHHIMDKYLLITETVEISHECYIYVLKDVMCVRWSTMDHKTSNLQDNALGSSPENPILIHNDELGSSRDNPILIQDDELG